MMFAGEFADHQKSAQIGICADFCLFILGSPNLGGFFNK
jgi:hypothetical protein